MQEDPKEMSAPREEDVLKEINTELDSLRKAQEEVSGSKKEDMKEVASMKAQDSTEDEADQGDQRPSRLKKAKWLPPDGWRRCGKGCAGCASKCVDQGLEDCQGCFHNKSRSVNSNSCLNRGACVDIKEQKESRSRSTHKKNMKKGVNSQKKLGLMDTTSSPAVTTRVNSHVVVSKLEFVKDAVGALEEREDKKRHRDVTGNTPEQEKKVSKIALPVRKAAGGKEPPAGQL